MIPARPVRCKGRRKGDEDMAEARLKAGLWVKAALRLGDVDGRPGMVLRRGDPDSGSVLVVVRSPDGVSVLSAVRSGDGEAAWMRSTGEAAVTDAEADAYVERQVNRDPDLWVLEFTGPDLSPPFDAKIV